MKALAVVALIFAALSIFIPIGGIYLAMLCSVLALISFRSQSTLSGITFGIDIINTAFLSPVIVLSDMHASGELDLATEATRTMPVKESGDVYFVFVGFHLVLLAIAIGWRLIRGVPRLNN